MYVYRPEAVRCLSTAITLLYFLSSGSPVEPGFVDSTPPDNQLVSGFLLHSNAGIRRGLLCLPSFDLGSVKPNSSPHVDMANYLASETTSQPIATNS